MASRVHIEFDSTQLRRNLANVDDVIDRNVSGIIEYYSSVGEAKMKNDAPWTDRTGAARTGLHTSTAHHGGKHQIIFAHSVPYGIWLEVKNSGRYEVIMPTVRFIGARVMHSISGVMGRMR